MKTDETGLPADSELQPEIGFPTYFRKKERPGAFRGVLSFFSETGNDHKFSPLQANIFGGKLRKVLSVSYHNPMASVSIPIADVTNDFQSFLEIEGNSRIFFSGRFGIGKTYFLSDFFASNEQYDVFHLFPVNYQISRNEDVVDLIKYDILVELLKKNKDIFYGNNVDGIKESYLLFYSWFKDRFSTNTFLQSILSMGESISSISGDPIMGTLGKLGRSFSDILEIDKEYQEFKADYISGEKKLVESFSKAIGSKVISEVDYFSHLLSEKINFQKGDKKSVLILDDLDRIDPEHVFRILNILSAYFEKEHQNKFGFDCVIIVADFENLKHIFHQKYGAAADFSGYLDKYFSITPYY